MRKPLWKQSGFFYSLSLRDRGRVREVTEKNMKKRDIGIEILKAVKELKNKTKKPSSCGSTAGSSSEAGLDPAIKSQDDK
jgi:hypothetical protein